MKGLVSVVVAAYNASKTLKKCLDSLLAQTYKNIEIIIVDDGSKDDTAFICDEYANKYTQIKVIHKENEGLGKARNTGIENANGEYICFFDSDDYFDNAIIEKLYTAVCNNKSDVGIFGYYDVDSKGNVLNTTICHSPKDLYKDNDVKEIFVPNMLGPDTKTGENWHMHIGGGFTFISMNKIKELNFRFASERETIYEDVYSLLKLYKDVNSVTIIKEPLYYYVRNDKSLSRSLDTNRYSKIKDFYNKCIEICKSYSNPKIIEERLNRLYISYTITFLQQVISSKNKYKDSISIIKDTVDSQLIEMINKIDLRYEKKTKRILYSFFKKRSYLLIYITIALSIHN